MCGPESQQWLLPTQVVRIPLAHAAAVGAACRPLKACLLHTAMQWARITPADLMVHAALVPMTPMVTATNHPVPKAQRDLDVPSAICPGGTFYPLSSAHRGAWCGVRVSTVLCCDLLSCVLLCRVVSCRVVLRCRWCICSSSVTAI